MDYLAYHFIVDPPQPGSEILAAMISEYPFESFDYSETGFTAYIKETDADNLNFDELQFPDFTFSYTIEKIAGTNWNEEWEKNFEPVVVGDLLCIRAPFHEKNTKVKHEIVIMPKMSFGTGHHQTTRLMCQQMFNTDLKGKRVLDMGCGTGVLAILAKILGAAGVLAIDIDEWSVENSQENCTVNGFPDIVVKKGDVDFLSDEKEFDIILANINKNVLKSHIPHYSKKLKPGGKLFLSGFFTTDVEELQTEATKSGLKFLFVASENEWAVVVLQK
jgi:ribosomal protein L11 methyltransferase